MIKLRKKYKELNLLVKKETEYKTIYDNTCTFLIQEKVTAKGKKTPKNIIFYTHHFTFSYIYYRQPQTVVIINWKCFEIVVKL